MLTISTLDKGTAGSYYSGEHAEYYTGAEHNAQWHGKGAELLGLSGRVDEQDFRAIMKNRTPDGDKLTSYQHKNRRDGYDFGFSVPKSVTLLHAIAQDPRIEKGLHNAVEATMREAVALASCQVGGSRTGRRTGNFIWADFQHETARPIKGISDPQLHIHAVVANATWDAEAGKWKAFDNTELKHNAEYYQAFFRATLAEQLQGMGYQLKNSEKDFEVKGIPHRAIAEFSRRAQEINELSKKLAGQRALMKCSPNPRPSSPLPPERKRWKG